MTLHNAHHRPAADLFDHSHEDQLANVLHEGPDVSKRAVPYYDTVWFRLGSCLVLALAIICAMNEAGCFGK